MHLLGSKWLRKMAEQAGATPHARLTGLIEILDNWLQAPGIEEVMRRQILDHDTAALNAFRTLVLDLVTPLHPHHPQELADQIVFLLLGAVRQQLRMPESQALLQAKDATLLLLGAVATKNRQLFSSVRQPMTLALSACLCLALVAGWMAPWHRMQPPVSPQPPANLNANIQSHAHFSAAHFNPDELVALHQQHEQFARGDCFYPMALMLPEDERGIYLNFVAGKTPMIGVADMNKASLGALRHALSSVECFYPQTAMVSS